MAPDESLEKPLLRRWVETWQRAGVELAALHRSRRGKSRGSDARGNNPLRYRAAIVERAADVEEHHDPRLAGGSGPCTPAFRKTGLAYQTYMKMQLHEALDREEKRVA